MKSSTTKKITKNVKNVALTDCAEELVCRMTAETRRVSPCLTSTGKMYTSQFLLLCTAHICKLSWNASCIGLEVANTS
jgi:hypothetical protein